MAAIQEIKDILTNNTFDKTTKIYINNGVEAEGDRDFNNKPLPIPVFQKEAVKPKLKLNIYQVHNILFNPLNNEQFKNLSAEFKNDVLNYAKKKYPNNEQIQNQRQFMSLTPRRREIIPEPVLINPLTNRKLKYTEKNVDKVANIIRDINKTRIERPLTKRYNIEDVIKAVYQISHGIPMVLWIDGKVGITLTNKNYKNLMDIIYQISHKEHITGFRGSDYEFLVDALRVGFVNIETLEKAKEDRKMRQKPAGAFFKWFNKTKLDLTRYGVFNDFNNENYNEYCLILALKNLGLEEVKLNHLKSFVRNREIPQCKLNEICEKLNIQIHLKTSKNRHILKYGKSGVIYNIGLIEEHYFLIDDVNVSRYSINNYNEVKDLKDWFLIEKKTQTGYYFRNKDIKTSSYNVIELMLQNEIQTLEKIKFDYDIMTSQYSDKFEGIENLEYNPKLCCKPTVYKEQEQKYEYKKYWLDFETDTTGEIHESYLCCLTWYENDNIFKRAFIGADCSLQMLNFLSVNSLLIAHNAGGYDFNFLVKYLYRINECCNGGSTMSADGIFYNRNTKKSIQIKIKDSLKMINMSLKKFGKTFQLDVMKEIMPYSIYTTENIKKVYVEINEALQSIENDCINDEERNFEDDKKQFLNNIKIWGLQNGTKYDIINYSKEYCFLDCIVLMKGYEIFKKWMLDATKLNIDNIISLASLADKYLIKEGCFENVFQLSGVPRAFIQKSVIGGRTMTCKNEKHFINDIINDFDAVSLYPSAMSKMGFLQGIPKVLNTTDYNIIKAYDGFFIEIEITKIGINRKFPLQSTKLNKDNIFDEYESRNFTNNLVGHRIVIDKIALEDFIKFQQVEFTVIKGYYFNEGFNYKIKEVITYLFNKRLEMQKLDNPAQLIYKELMNSAYGKTIMKAVDSAFVYKYGIEEHNKFIRYNYNFIKEIFIICDKKYIYRYKMIKPINEHFSRPQVGSSILAMSKRIMNEVMCLAEDLKLDMYYQDTDSIHIKDNQIKTLSIEFEKVYGRTLIGKHMGQFHSDFKCKGADEEKEVVAIKSIFLGKKCYIDVLQSQDKENNIINDFHIRLKGVPNKSIKHYCKNNNITVDKLYEGLYNGDEIEFDLLCKVEGEATTAKFKKNNNKTISSVLDFKRNIKFD